MLQPDPPPLLSDRAGGWESRPITCLAVFYHAEITLPPFNNAEHDPLRPKNQFSPPCIPHSREACSSVGRITFPNSTALQTPVPAETYRFFAQNNFFNNMVRRFSKIGDYSIVSPVLCCQVSKLSVKACVLTLSRGESAVSRHIWLLGARCGYLLISAAILFVFFRFRFYSSVVGSERSIRTHLPCIGVQNQTSFQREPVFENQEFCSHTPADSMCCIHG